MAGRKPKPTAMKELVHCKLIICHIHLSDCPYTASASIVNARIDSFGFIVYEQSSFANVPVI